MKHYCAAMLAAAIGLLLNRTGLEAQRPGDGANAARAAPPATARPLAPPPGSAPAPGAPPCKICVSEPKPNTRKVYACKDEEYCLPHRSFLSLLRGQPACAGGHCSDVRIRHRLVVKKVEDGNTAQCVVREVPLPSAPVCAPATPGGDRPAIPGKR